MKILIADDHEIVRTGLKQLLESHNTVEKVLEASNGEKVLQIIEQHVE
ncbi:MAG: response regulator [Melioribacteraceae bacterium]|nr:response regulator [Melioribacteraceae bacterium]